MTATPNSPSTPPAVLVLGANGRFGCAAAQAFAAAGWRVFAQVRRDAVAEMPESATLVRATLDDTAALAVAAHGATLVVHAISPLYTRSEDALPALRAGLAIAARLGAHFMLPGTVYNFGERMPALLREDTPQHPTQRKGEIRVEMEAMMARHSAATGLRSSVLRAGDFFGSGTGGWLDQAIVKSLRDGKLVYPGALDIPHAWAYLPDLARAMVAVAGHRSTGGFENWHFAGHTLTGRELLDGLEVAAASLGLRPVGGLRRGRLWWPPMHAIGLFVPMLRELARMSYLWRVPHALDGQRLAALPGVRSTPLPTALRQSLIELGMAQANRAIVPA